ncbi:phosphoserine phosphatase [Candidatus Tenderia electrophaga]|jgi:phosphoserine phosphatase|uniref:Phosphoserine phosphatase n=1 Tax=Candidatus Tenderia electrophaga TaxID=1748243 RepID=A0A0S2T957_9GAMM|nr:phosphoserine phosphatase [Candidatus Tenderia electrophaga]
MATLVLQGPRLTEQEAVTLSHSFNGRLEEHKGYYRIQVDGTVDPAKLAMHKQQEEFDINLLPAGFDPAQVKLLVTDMDSTLISIECIDEIADFIDVKPQVSEITEAAMRGEIDFETSLRRRIALLKGLEPSALDHVYNECLALNPGAKQMLAGLKARDIKTTLVSGGFTYFTERLKERLGLDYTLANVLEFENGKLTGEIHGHIVGAEAKADFLLQKCEELNIDPSQAVAMGDGANDLVMMQRAGLSIAYHAKPKVQDQAHAALNHCGLEGVLGLLNINM